MVESIPPINPSQVFFGDNSMSLVFPKKNPKIYAKVSLAMINKIGTQNQIYPEYKFERTAETGATSMKQHK